MVLKNNPGAKRLPAIVPVVVHHGERGWTSPVAFEELIDAESETLAALLPFLPRFRFLRVALAPNGPSAIWALMRYILLVAEAEPEELHDFIRRFGPAAEEAFMTGAEILRKEGEARGEA
jgi:hypothetical protein